MTGQYTFHDVWQKNDARAEQDVIAAWRAANVLPAGDDPAERARQLAVVGYDGGKLAAVSTAAIKYLKHVRQTMAMFRIFIVPEYRRGGIAVPLTHALFAAMERYALANPQLRIGGIAASVEVKGFLHKPILPAGLVLAGYNEINQPIVLQWFEHFELDEEAALLRVPSRAKSGVQGD